MLFVHYYTPQVVSFQNNFTHNIQTQYRALNGT